MNRAFISLYVLIVLSVVLLGWGADALWKNINPEADIPVMERALIDTISEEVKALNSPAAQLKVAHLSQVTSVDIKLYTLEDIAQSHFFDTLKSGKILPIYDQNGRKSIYKRIPGRDLILRISVMQQSSSQALLSLVLLCLFYLAIAVVVYFWVWPLSRDLSKLERQTYNLGKDGVPKPIKLWQRSAVYPLAASFNAMSERITELIASHKEMSHAVSHELRTPLARMKFALEMAHSSRDDAQRELQLQGIKMDVNEMDALINDLLRYAGYEHYSQDLDLRAGDLAAMAQVLFTANESMQNSHVVYRIDNRLDKQGVYCEWHLIERCLHNLVQNAFRYARSQILMTLCYSDEGQNYQVCVEDDGPGISEDDAERVFSAFVRLRNESGEKTSGFGLGLSIVKRIMKWHKGDVSLERSPLGGARFVLHWPVPAPQKNS
ncbi:MAG: two-component sensor histidine kinase [Alteromonadaceae bacterium]|nr:MAG: two-component sensor histidine kinase [Alteromonadaceae bacterium]